MVYSLVVSANAQNAIRTTDVAGTIVNLNKFQSAEDVYVTGGGAVSGLTDGTWYFEVTDPSGKVLLSSDNPACRLLTVFGGIVTGPAGACPHGFGTAPDGSVPVQLAPFDLTPNSGGEYKVTIYLFDENGKIAEQKSDNFKIKDTCKLSVTVTDFSGCNADLATGSLTAATTPPGAANNATFVWTLPDGVTKVTTPTPTLSGPLVAGDYVVAVSVNRCTAFATGTVTVTDLCNPSEGCQIKCPADTTLECGVDYTIVHNDKEGQNGEPDPEDTGIPAVDGDGCTFDWSDSRAPGSCAGSVVITRTWTVYNSDGTANGSCTQTITIKDTTAPVITPTKTDATLACNASAADIEAALGSATATDCDTVVVHADDTDNPTLGCVHSKTRTFTAKDGCDNVAEPKSVTVKWKVDTDGPVITPAKTDATLACNASAAEIEAALGTATATDNCGEAVSVTPSDSGVTSAGTCLSKKTRTFNAIDECGNPATPVSVTVTWKVDTTGPVITPTKSDANLGCNPSADKIATALGTASATDLCDGTVLVTPSDSDVTSAGTCLSKKTRTFNAIDECGNPATPVTVTVTWKVDLDPPTIGNPGNNKTAYCNQSWTFDPPTASDGCGSASVEPVGKDQVVLGSCGTQTITRTWRAVDACGNPSANTVSQTVVVECIACGGLSKGFWSNKNGQAIITGSACTAKIANSGTWLRLLAPFQDLSSTATPAQVATYVLNVIKGADASGASMNAMLKAQMLATALDVYFSDPALGGNKIGAPGPLGTVKIDLTHVPKPPIAPTIYENTSSAFGGGSCQTVMALLTYAASQSNPGGTVWYGQVKATQELAKDTFDAIDNSAAFSCP
jgi:hypothetical protein